MINITILTSENNTLVEHIVQYFTNYPDANICGVISNKENDIQKKLRRYRIPIKITNQYKEMDKFLTEINSHFVIMIDYNEKIPTNFCKKYILKLINFKKTNNGINVFYEKETFTPNNIIFKKEIDISNNTLTELNDKINDLAINFYPTLIENIIRDTYKKIYKNK